MGGVEAASDPFLGRVLDGRYAIEERLGEGGLGVVYRAKQTRLGRAVAVKVLHAEHAQKTALKARFDREARSLGTLVHPNIVQVIDYGIEDGAPFLVMELLEGRPLNDAIRSGIALDRAWEIGRTIVSAVAYAHARRVVHRDLKPANVFLQRDSEGNEITRVLDFGLAKFVDDDSDDTVLTKAGSILGTPAYMSPEQASGGATDERSDVYSLGIVLYELLTGQRPFQGPPVELLRMHLIAELPPLRQARPGIPNADAIDAVLKHATAKSVGDRYADAGELLAALDAVPHPSAELVSGVAERPRDVSLDATMLGERAQATPLGFGASTQSVRTDTPSPSPGAQPRTKALVLGAALLVLGIGAAAAALSGEEGEAVEGAGADAIAADTDEEVHAATAGSGTAADAPPPYRRCDGAPPSAVVLARVAPGAPIPSARDIVSSFSGIPLESIVVRRLSGPTDELARRSVTFELSRSTWPEWAQLAEGSPEEVCRSVAGAIASRVARPLTALEFHADPEPGVRAEPLGALTSLDPEDVDAAILDWLEPPRTSTQCKFEPDYGGGGTLVISCDVTNPRRAAARFEVTPLVYRDEEGQPVYREQLALEPGQRIVREYRVRAGSPSDFGGCACEITTAR